MPWRQSTVLSYVAVASGGPVWLARRAGERVACLDSERAGRYRRNFSTGRIPRISEELVLSI